MLPLGRRHDLARGIVQIVGGDQLQPRLAQDAPAELDIGAFEPHDQRHVQIDLARRRDNALGEHVAAHDAAEDVDQDRLDIGVGQDQLERDRDPLPRRAAADIEKIGRHRAIELDDVHRRHREPGAVDHAADIAVELDIAQLVLAGLALDRVLLVLVAQGLDLGMAEQRVVVDRQLGVERQQIACRIARAGHDQRIDLDQRRVEFDKGPIQRADKLDHRRDLPTRQAERKGEPAGMERRQPGGRIDREAYDLFRRMRRQLLDFHAAFAGADQRDPPGPAIDRQREIQLARDVDAGLDKDPLDDAPLGAGLMRHQCLADQRARRRRDLVLGARDLDPACLAASAGMDLRLDGPELAPLGPPSRFAASTASAAV